MNNKAAKGTWAAAFTVASVWFGTHVGGGFASGNQVVSYFAQYGMWAAVLPLVAMGILALVMYTVMKFAKLNGFTNYKDTFSALYPKPWMEVFFEIFYIVILLAAVAAAVAGAGEVLANFFGVDYSVTANKLIFNLIIVAVLIILSIFGVKLVIAASTVLSIAILISTAVVVIAGFAADFDAISANLLAQNSITAAPYVDNAGEAIWRGVLVYAAFQCVSIPAMIAAGEGLTLKGVKRANILGWLMNGLALAASTNALSLVSASQGSSGRQCCRLYHRSKRHPQPDRSDPRRHQVADGDLQHSAVQRFRFHQRHPRIHHDPALPGRLLPQDHQERKGSQCYRRRYRHRYLLCDLPARPRQHHQVRLRLRRLLRDPRYLPARPDLGSSQGQEAFRREEG